MIDARTATPIAAAASIVVVVNRDESPVLLSVSRADAMSGDFAPLCFALPPSRRNL